jgi:hypothetical protein
MVESTPEIVYDIARRRQRVEGKDRESAKCVRAFSYFSSEKLANNELCNDHATESEKSVNTPEKPFVQVQHIQRDSGTNFGAESGS